MSLVLKPPLVLPLFLAQELAVLPAVVSQLALLSRPSRVLPDLLEELVGLLLA